VHFLGVPSVTTFANAGIVVPNKGGGDLLGGNPFHGCVRILINEDKLSSTCASTAIDE
jgi:hypothetical protein